MCPGHTLDRSSSSFKARQDGRGWYYGWQEIVAGGVELHEVPGDHTSMLDEPNVQVLAAQLRNCLDRSQGMTPRPSSAN
jgi:thioesterase domain-containing protein